MVYYEEPCFDYLDSVIVYIKYLIFEIKNSSISNLANSQHYAKHLQMKMSSQISI